MHVFLWVVQSVLAAAFAPSGVLAAVPRERLTGMFPWAADSPRAMLRVIGVSGLLGGIGVVLPAAVGVAPVLTPLAATGLAVMMALAAAFHVRRGERPALVLPVVLLLLAALVAVGRFGPYAW
jgi:uncharacterized membrane protein